VPEAEDLGFQRGDLPVREARCSAGMLLDNFLDFAHFPFVHWGTFGAEEEREVEPYSPQVEGDVVRLRLEHWFANREDPAVARGVRPLRQRRVMSYECTPLFFARLRLDFVDAGGTNTIALVVRPETAERCRIHSSLFQDDRGGGEVAMAEAVAYEQRILEEDLAVQETLDDLRLPLALPVEVHARADRITVELRRALARFLADGRSGPG
jgi:phenylpropionate dioxygenase-like ring-hydroxylating dioxygenase large terminal subunit